MSHNFMYQLFFYPCYIFHILLLLCTSGRSEVTLRILFRDTKHIVGLWGLCLGDSHLNHIDFYSLIQLQHGDTFKWSLNHFNIPRLSGCPSQESNTSAVDPSTAFCPKAFKGLNMGIPFLSHCKCHNPGPIVKWHINV